MTVHAYCQQIKVITDLLTNIDKPVPEKTLVTYMVNGLDEKFDQLAGSICHQDPLSSFLKARSMLVREEFRLSRLQPQHGVHRDNASALNILFTGFGDSSRPPFNSTHGERQNQDRRQQGDCQNQDQRQHNDR
ncbi:uncharacterized protein LOC111894202 [Lactuca sativa]|uniref:uncharacterized protein LOC111894202 n=1 Tax=Lactuca sativa TaxID=4236 RepID=UPI000CD863AA|nr:uncharacterized protein LOC111894202 [Lactuca sativa]